MANFEIGKGFNLLALIFILTGALILILTVLNYIQDGKISLTAIIGLLVISIGFYLLAYGKKAKSSDE
jgi:hypothetical protein